MSDFPNLEALERLARNGFEDQIDVLALTQRLRELREAAWLFKTEITGAMVMQEGGTLVNLYARFVNQTRIQGAHDRLLAAINAADQALSE